jgi:dihydroorotase
MSAGNGQRPPLALLGGRLLDPASGYDGPADVLIEDGRIRDFGPGLLSAGRPDGLQVLDCGGLCIAPGLIDMRVQLREPGEEHKETIASAGRAAAAGGVTALVALPNTDPVVDDIAGVEYIARRAREAKLVKVYSYAALTRNMEGRELTQFGLLREIGALGFTDGLKALADAQTMRRALSYARAFDALILQHPEEPSLADGAMNEGETATRLGLSGIPTAAEVIMVERDLRLVELTGGRYHAAHLSTAGAVSAIRRAKADGLPVTCDTAPHYFTLNENAVGDYRTFAKVSPPLRSESDRQAIEDGLADGTIDAIASDHAPHDQESKRLPFAIAAAGILGLETLLPLSLALYHKGRLSLLEVIRRLSLAPADILGLARSGRIAGGLPADLTVFDPDEPWVVDPDKFLSKSKNSPFGDHPVQGKARHCFVDGRDLLAQPQKG